MQGAQVLLNVEVDPFHVEHFVDLVDNPTVRSLFLQCST